MSKRPASDISPSIETDNNNDTGVCAATISNNTTNNNNNNNHNNNNNTTTTITSTTTTREHYIEQTIVGPVCTHLNCKTKLGTNFTVSDDTLRRHWKKNKCYSGNDIPNATKLVRKLDEQLVSMVERNQRNPSHGQQMVDQLFSTNNTTTRSSGYCRRCGYCKIPSLVKHHIKAKTKCNMVHFVKQGTILEENVYGCKMPQEILTSLANGTFKLPFLSTSTPPISPPNIQRTTNNTNNNNSAAASSSVNTFNTSPPNTSTSEPTIFTASQSEMNKACSPTHVPTVINEDSRVIEEIKQCFGITSTEEAMKHISTFVHYMNQPHGFKTTIMNLANKQKPLLNKPTALRLLLAAGELWLKSGAANLDVNMLSANVRNMIYLVGSYIPDSKKDLQRGNTFVPTGDMKDVASVYETFVTFVYQIDTPLIADHKRQVLQIYDSIGESVETEDERENAAAARIADTTVIPGLLSTLLLQHPPVANGTNIIGDFIAGATVKVTGNVVGLRNVNEVSSGANALLRLVRHALCSMFTRRSRDFDNDTNFQRWMKDLLVQAQQSFSYDVISRRIRTAREMDKKKPNLVRKDYDARTGEVFAGGYSITKTLWSQSISITNEKWRSVLYPLYNNCTELLDKVLNVNNRLVVDTDGDQSKVIISSGTADEEEILISSIHPTLPDGDKDIKRAIYNCWKYDIGAHAYLSSGAARGKEITRLPDLKFSQFIFNCVRFQLHSRKGEDHGVKENEMVEHFLPPSLSRLTLIHQLSLYPALTDSLSYNIPDLKHADRAADNMFTEIMGFHKNIGTKLARDLMGQITNYIAPQHLGKTSTNAQTARQFHHSQAVHHLRYSSETFETDASGNVIRRPLMIARDIWSALGESSESFASIRTTQISHRNFSREEFDYVAQRAYRSAAARISDQQFNAITHAMTKQQHSFVLMGCGTGKSGIYIMMLLACNLHAVTPRRSIVISPHNALLTMHHMQAIKYFTGTSLRVEMLLPTNITSGNIPDEFDLLFISIHAFNNMMTEHPHQLKQWNVKNIFIDEYHNIFGELFRHTTSWISLKHLASNCIPITLLSATANPCLMHFVGNYLGLGTFKTIGDVRDYPIPNVVINVECHDDTSVLQLLVERVKQLNSTKDWKFKVHIVVMTKEDATSVSNALTNAGISCLSLTSDHIQSEKENIMARWEEREDQCMASTIVDGIDNGLVENVILFRGCYSVSRLVQTLGRIRPPRQNFDKATLDILDTGYDPVHSGDIDGDINYIKQAGMAPSTASDETLQDFYSNLFHTSGYRRFINHRECYRKYMFDACGIPSQDCNQCSNCRNSQEIVAAASQASAALSAELKNKQFVREQLSSMIYQCYACKRSECDGSIASCLGKESKHYCFSCHAESIKANFHRKCPAGNLSTNQQSCPYCLLALDQAIPQSGTRDDHKPNKCVFKDRIKRVLLYQVQHVQDMGITAKSTLQPCLINNDIWYKVMGENMRHILSLEQISNDDNNDF